MFANKVVLVTGGSSGIGAATVKLFIKEGASVAFVGRNETKLKDIVQHCGAKSFAIKADVSKVEEAKNIVKQTVDKFGKLDVLVNNAGIVRYAGVTQSNLLETYDEVMNTNLRAVILITNLAVPHLIKSKGNIVNVSSVSSTDTKLPGLVAYSISKAGIDQFTRLAALELASSGVRVNAVSPGPVATEMITSSDLPTDFKMEDVVKTVTALGRPSDAEEIGDMILYLASDKARSMTGSRIVIDNGMTVK